MGEYINCRDCPEFDICHEKVDCTDWKTATEDPIHDYAYSPGPWAEKCIRIKKENELREAELVYYCENDVKATYEIYMYYKKYLKFKWFYDIVHQIKKLYYRIKRGIKNDEC